MIVNNNIMIACNPIFHLRQAWTRTESWWGKAAIVLFHSFVWIQILGAAWSLYDTTTGWECLYDTLSSKSDAAFVTGTMKTVNVWILGFFMYADFGGIQVKNVFMVNVCYLGQFLLYKPVMTEFLADTCAETLQMFNASMIVTAIWILLALLCSLMEARKAKGSALEESPLLSSEETS